MIVGLCLVPYYAFLFFLSLSPLDLFCFYFLLKHPQPHIKNNNNQKTIITIIILVSHWNHYLWYVTTYSKHFHYHETIPHCQQIHAKAHAKITKMYKHRGKQEQIPKRKLFGVLRQSYTFFSFFCHLQKDMILLVSLYLFCFITATWNMEPEKSRKIWRKNFVLSCATFYYQSYNKLDERCNQFTETLINFLIVVPCNLNRVSRNDEKILKLTWKI